MNLRPISVVAEPVSLAQAKLHLRVDDDGDSPPNHPDDPLIESLITTARTQVENFTARSLAVIDYVYRIADFEPCIYLPRPPVISVASVEYQDDAGAWTIVDEEVYTFDDDLFAPVIVLNANEEWPTPGDYPNPVRITYRAGYGDDESPPMALLPKPLYQAILLLVGHFYENRENVGEKQGFELPLGAETLMRPYRLWRTMA